MLTQNEKGRRSAEAWRYLGKLRCGPKREYAIRYWNFLVGFFPHAPEPTGLGAMGAQAVRLRLEPIWRGEV